LSQIITSILVFILLSGCLPGNSDPSTSAGQDDSNIDLVLPTIYKSPITVENTRQLLTVTPLIPTSTPTILPPMQTQSPVPVTATSISTPTTLVNSCPGAQSPRLKINEEATVCTQEDCVYLRADAGKKYAILSCYKPGYVFMVVGGPICEDNTYWWQVATRKGFSGWMMEGWDAIDPYYLCPSEGQ
jgi:uncharacterized protein YgiM (DUF1202 family)